MNDKEKRLAKAIEAALDSAVQTPDPNKQKSQLVRALKYVRRLLPASKWGGELSLLRYRVGNPKRNEELSKTNFQKWRKLHLAKLQTQLPILSKKLPAGYIALHEELKKCPNCSHDTHPIQYEPDWHTNWDPTSKKLRQEGPETFTLRCGSCLAIIGKCDLQNNLISDLSNREQGGEEEPHLSTPSKESDSPSAPC